jgi:hypothetical protein
MPTGRALESDSTTELVQEERQLDIVLLKEKVETQQRLNALMKKFGLLFYKPHKKQILFHESAHFRFRLARCGNRFGKSDMGVSEDLAFALGERPWYPEGHPMRYHGIPKHATKGLVVCADDSKVDEIFTGDGKKGHVGKIWKKIPRDLVIGTPKRSSSGTITSLRIKGKYGESVIDFATSASFKTNPKGSESSDYDWAHIDEPIEEAHWKAILRGLTDRMGKAWFTCTLIEEPWINDFFFTLNDTERPKVEDQRKEFFEVLNEQTGRPVKFVMTGSIYDNPYLNQEAIDDFLSALTEDERACRISGMPMYMSGVIYKQFQYQRHVLQEVPKGWEDFHLPPYDYTVHYAIDPHPRTPHAVLFIAVSPEGRAYIFDELFITGDAKELASAVKPILHGRHVCTRIMDPAAFVEDQRNKSVFADDLAAEGLAGLEKAPKDLQRGITAVQTALKDPDFIYVSPRCRTFLWEIGRYAWDDKNGVPTNKPVDKDDHMMECFYRLVLRGLTYYPLNSASTPTEDLEIDLFTGVDNDYGNLSL